MSTALPQTGCPYCGVWVTHQGICPMVEEVEYHPDGTLKRVRLRSTHTADAWPPFKWEPLPVTWKNPWQAPEEPVPYPGIKANG